ncbi:MAG: hypothetical protein WCT00_07015, partial [Bacilli bacterium]
MTVIDYKSEVRRYLELRAKGQVGTQREFFDGRLQETGCSGSFQYFKKTLKLLRASSVELPPKPAVKPAEPPKPPAPKKKSGSSKKGGLKKETEKRPEKKPNPKREKKRPGRPRVRKDPTVQPSPDWEQLKRDYLTWRYATIREVAVAIGWNYMGTGFREAT